MDAPVCVIVLTLDEELNLPFCLESVGGWARQLFVVDSFSSDRTEEIARAHGAGFYQNPFEHWAAQRNWALDNLPIGAEWVLFLDADEQVTPPLALEMARKLPGTPPEVAGYYIDRRLIFMGRWLRHGIRSSNWVLRLVRPERTRVIPMGDSEYFRVSGQLRRLEGHLLHEDHRDLSFWIAKHNRISELAARKLLSERGGVEEEHPPGSLEGSRRVWLRREVLDRMPLLMRPFLLFAYRYILCLGVLDGRAGFIYYFMHDFWYPLLVAAKAIELKRGRKKGGQS